MWCQILKVSKKCDIMEEGCLSFPDTLVEVIRRCRIDLEYTDLDGNVTEERFTDISARIIQHELDHLEGVSPPCLQENILYFMLIFDYNIQVLLVDKMNDRNRL